MYILYILRARDIRGTSTEIIKLLRGRGGRYVRIHVYHASCVNEKQIANGNGSICWRVKRQKKKQINKQYKS